MKKTINTIIASLLSLTILTCCTTNNTTSDTNTNSNEQNIKEIKVLAYDSFNLDKNLIKEFEKTSGYKVKIIPSGGGGELVNKLVLSKNTPMGDVSVGIDSTFAGRTIKEKIFQNNNVKLPEGAEKYVIAGDKTLTPISHGQICLNADKQWFDSKNIKTPETFTDIIKPEYKNLFASINPTTSSAGLGFFLSTVAKFGENGWQKYWQDLKNNGMKISKDWSGAYNVDFTAGEGKGTKPIVVSYVTSPLETLETSQSSSNLPESTTKTVALTDTCYDQVEYAGIVRNAKNKEGAEKFIEFMLSKKVQDVLLDTMYVFPVSNEATIPDEVLQHTPPVENALRLDPVVLEEKRQEWLREWNSIITQ